MLVCLELDELHPRPPRLRVKRLCYANRLEADEVFTSNPMLSISQPWDKVHRHRLIVCIHESLHFSARFWMLRSERNHFSDSPLRFVSMCEGCVWSSSIRSMFDAKSSTIRASLTFTSIRIPFSTTVCFSQLSSKRHANRLPRLRIHGTYLLGKKYQNVTVDITYESYELSMPWVYDDDDDWWWWWWWLVSWKNSEMVPFFAWEDS